MIIYDRLWATMKKRKITQYQLINNYCISRGQLSRIKHNRNINTFTINKLCTILDCKVEDIMEYISEEYEQQIISATKTP